jgi:hypothetical protein
MEQTPRVQKVHVVIGDAAEDNEYFVVLDHALKLAYPFGTRESVDRVLVMPLEVFTASFRGDGTLYRDIMADGGPQPTEAAARKAADDARAKREAETGEASDCGAPITHRPR